MTKSSRLKRSFFCATAAVIASTVGVLTLGLISKQPTANLDTSGLLLNLVGIPLSPGWFLTRGVFERINVSSLSQVLMPALTVLMISIIVDTGFVFALWEVFRISARRASSS